MGCVASQLFISLALHFIYMARNALWTATNATCKFIPNRISLAFHQLSVHPSDNVKDLFTWSVLHKAWNH